jgi:hypothetical protein
LKFELTKSDPDPSGFAPSNATWEAKSVPGDHQNELARNSDRALHIERRAKRRKIPHSAVERASTADLNAASLQDPLALCAATFVHIRLR